MPVFSSFQKLLELSTEVTICMISSSRQSPTLQKLVIIFSKHGYECHRLSLSVMNIHSVPRAKQGSQKIKYLSESTTFSRAESKKSKGYGRANECWYIKIKAKEKARYPKKQGRLFESVGFPKFEQLGGKYKMIRDT